MTASAVVALALLACSDLDSGGIGFDRTQVVERLPSLSAQLSITSGVQVRRMAYLANALRQTKVAGNFSSHPLNCVTLCGGFPARLRRRPAAWIASWASSSLIPHGDTGTLTLLFPAFAPCGPDELTSGHRL
jgi:hypothetical protein